MSKLDELKEAAELARENRALAPVSLTMAILAVLVAAVGVLAHRSHTQEILMQTRATDQWAYYQAKNIRRNNLEALDDLITALESTKAERAEEVRARFRKDIEKYRTQQGEIQNGARGFETGAEHAGRRADRFDLGEVFLEMALVVTSITLLTQKRSYWFFGIALAVAGLAVTSTGFLVS